MSKCSSCPKKCKCHRRKKCKRSKRAKHTHVAGANCCSSFKNVFSC